MLKLVFNLFLHSIQEFSVHLFLIPIDTPEENQEEATNIRNPLIVCDLISVFL